MKAGRAATAALASGALMTAGGSAAALITTAAQAHPAGATCGWGIPAGNYNQVPLTDSNGHTLGSPTKASITLYYNTCNQHVKGLVSTGSWGACDGFTCTGTAQIYLSGTPKGSPCSIPAGATACKSGEVNDAGITQYAKGHITIGAPGFTDSFTAATSPY